MFYKNALYVAAGHFWPGTVSAWSGQTMYDPLIYQVYNIFMTSLPIVWYTMYDYASGKEDDIVPLIPLPYPDGE
jgi:phospholipid-transporting ATPase